MATIAKNITASISGRVLIKGTAAGTIAPITIVATGRVGAAHSSAENRRQRLRHAVAKTLEVCIKNS